MGTSGRRYQVRYALPFDAERRRLLQRGALGAAALGIVGVVGCSSNNSNKNNTAKATASATAAGAAPSASAAAGAAATRAGTAAPAAGGASPAAAASGAAANVKKGGVMTKPMAGPMATLDPQATGNYVTLIGAAHMYSRLLMYASGPGVDIFALDKVTPDAAASYEIADNGLTYNFKLRPNVKFTDPLNRAMTAQDVVFSYQRFMGKAANSKPGPNAGLVSQYLDTVTAPDNATVVMKLKQAFFPALTFFVSSFYGYILPSEAGSSIDPTKQMVGSGPWILSKYDPSSGASYKRNPQWHFGPDLPYLDGLEEPIVSDSTARLTQFLAGKLDYTSGVTPPEFLRVHDQMKNAVWDQTSVGISGIAFSARDPNSPWNKDVRVRQAISNMLDRDGTSDAAYQYKDLKNVGIDLPIRWNNFIPPKFSTLWLDPQGKEIDPNVARFFKYDVQAAKQLLSAAGLPNGFTTVIRYPPQYPPDYKTVTELTAQYMTKGGVNTSVVEEDYASVYVPNTRMGNFDGTAMYSTLEPEGSLFLQDFFAKNGSINLGKINDPDFDQRLTAAQATLDAAKRRQQLIDLQNYLDGKMYYVPLQASTGPSFTTYQPWFSLAKDYTGTDQIYGWPTECAPHWWRQG